MNYNKTLNKELTITGIGIHTGLECIAKFVPKANGGIVFHYKDKQIPATLENVSSTQRGTNLAKDDVEIYTIEHILSSLYAVGVTDLDIYLMENQDNIHNKEQLHKVSTGLDILHSQLRKERYAPLENYIKEITKE